VSDAALPGAARRTAASTVCSADSRKISVFIGNPPYNANQLNENNNNKMGAGRWLPLRAEHKFLTVIRGIDAAASLKPRSRGRPAAGACANNDRRVSVQLPFDWLRSDQNAGHLN